MFINIITVYVMLCWKNKSINIIIIKYVFDRNVHLFWPKRPSFLAETSIFFGRIVHVFSGRRFIFFSTNWIIVLGLDSVLKKVIPLALKIPNMAIPDGFCYHDD